MTLEILVLAWDRHENVAGLNRQMGSQPAIQLLCQDAKFFNVFYFFCLLQGQNIC